MTKPTMIVLIEQTGAEMTPLLDQRLLFTMSFENPNPDYKSFIFDLTRVIVPNVPSEEIEKHVDFFVKKGYDVIDCYDKQSFYELLMKYETTTIDSLPFAP